MEKKPQLKSKLYEAFKFSQRLLCYLSCFYMLGSFCHQATSKLFKASPNATFLFFIYHSLNELILRSTGSS